jgi:hypothetical protein
MEDAMSMIILVQPDNLGVSRPLEAWTRRALAGIQKRFGGRITRIDARFSDLNGPRKGPSDVRCIMEARVNGRPPIAVEHRSGDAYLCAERAARKLLAAVEHSLSRRATRAVHAARARARRWSDGGVGPVARAGRRINRREGT